MKTRIVMVGSKGRMGQAIIALARASNDYEIVAEVDQGDRLEEVIARGDVSARKLLLRGEGRVVPGRGAETRCEGV